MTGWPSAAAWRVGQAAVLLVTAFAGWRLFGDPHYRIDADVYRMGGQAWLDGRPLYADAMFATRSGLELPFTYPPLAAVAFSPLALLGLDAAGVVITVLTLVLLVVSEWIVLARLGVPATTGRRAWLAVGLVALAVLTLEPVRSTISFGQINVMLMTLVIADCLPRRTPWPRGILLGLAIALKLTPAVFLLFFVLRRDWRATAWTLVSFAAATLVGFAVAPRDSWEYWTHTLADTDRIGSATWNTNQNAAGALARLSLGGSLHFAVWTAVCLAVLALTVWAVRRVLAAGEPTLALMCVALFGLVVSPVSWSHHWVWALPTLTVVAVLAHRRRNAALAVLGAAGAVMFVSSPFALLPEHNEAGAAWWRQLVGVSYVWWALALIAAAGWTVAGPAAANRPRSRESARPADLVGRG